MPIKEVGSGFALPVTNQIQETIETASAKAEAVPARSESGYIYTGRDSNGQLIKNARIPFQALSDTLFRLEIAGITVEKVWAVSEVSTMLDINRRSAPGAKDMASLAEQIAAQKKTGLTYSIICADLGRSHEKDQVKNALKNVSEMLIEGHPTFEAFAAQVNAKGKPFFPTTFVYAFQIAEKVGALQDPETGISEDAASLTLRYFAKEQRKSAAVAKAIFMGLISPAALFICTVAAFIFQMYFIVPQFAVIFQGMLSGKDTSLPLPTQIMISISEFFYSYSGILLMLSLTAGTAFAIYKYYFTDKGIEQRRRKILVLPILKSFFVPGNAATFARNMAIMFADPDLNSRFATISATTVNPAFKDLAEHCREVILVKSVPFADMFAGHLHLMGNGFLSVAETVDANPSDAQKLLYTYALFLEERADDNLGASITTLNTLVYAFCALLVGLVILGSYYPLFDLIGRLAGK